MKLLRILLIEDPETEPGPVIPVLEQAGFAVRFEKVQDARGLTAALDREPWDAAICEYRAHGFATPEAIGILRATGRDIPCLVVSGTGGEDLAVAMMRAGAQDYLMKGDLSRLAASVEREMREAGARAESRQTERQARESQDRLALAVQATQLGTFEYNISERRLMCSGIAELQFGGTPDQPASPALLWRHIRNDDRRRVRRLLIRALRGRADTEMSFEVPLSRVKDAENAGAGARWLVVRGRVLFDSTGKPARIIGTSRDITDQKQAEEAFRYQLDLTRAIAHQTSDSIFVTDPDDRVTYMNPEAERVFGFRAEELTGQILHDMIHHHYPDGRFFPRSECQMGQAGKARESTRDHEDLLFRKDGTPVYASCSSVPLTLNGVRIGVVVTIRDISGRKAAERALRESEARFRRLAEAGIIGIVIGDSECILEANDYFLGLLGHSRKTFEPGTIAWKDITPPEHAAAARRSIETAMRSGSAPPIETEYVLRDGGRIPVLTGGVVVDYGGRRCFMGFALDRTAHRNLEEQVRQSQKLDTVGRLAGGIAHDFNNLLTIMLGYSQMMAAEIGESHPLYERMDQVVRAATRASGLTRQLLTFSRQTHRQPKVIGLNGVVLDVEKMLRRLAGENITVSLSLSHDAATIYADSGQIEQVIVNLALNARDAMPDGGSLWIETGRLKVEEEFAALCLSVAPGEYAQLVVSDTGVGMTEEVQARIFEPFFTTKEPGKGTGLGLSTVYGIVKQSGGAISVHSSPGLGTTVRILFPATHSAALPDADRPAGQQPVVAGSGTVLVIEDQDGVLQYVTEILRQAGYAVLAAGSALEAFELADEYEGRIDLVLTDFLLPGMKGPEAALRIRNGRPDTRIVVMSGYTDQPGRSHDHEAFLQKPFSQNELLTVVRGVLTGTRGANPVQAPAGSQLPG